MSSIMLIAFFVSSGLFIKNTSLMQVGKCCPIPILIIACFLTDHHYKGANIEKSDKAKDSRHTF